MKNIKRIISYYLYEHELFDVVYKSGIVKTYSKERLPQTAKAFFIKANKMYINNNNVLNRTEVIFEFDEV